MIFQKNIFKNKNTLITGATGKIGEEISKSFANLESNLILIDKNISKLRNLKKKIQKKNIEIHIFQCNFLSQKSRIILLSKLRKKIKKVDNIINNAGFTGLQNNSKGWNGDFSQQNLKFWHQAMEINLTSIFHLTKGISEFQSKNNSFAIINVGSIYAERGPDLNLYENSKLGSPAGYLSSKGGLLMLTKWFASYLAPTRVNMISPGGIHSGQPKKFLKNYKKKILIKRMCKTGDVANLAIFLCSNYSNYITGQNIKVDGGFTSI